MLSPSSMFVVVVEAPPTYTTTRFRFRFVNCPRFQIDTIDWLFRSSFGKQQGLICRLSAQNAVASSSFIFDGDMVVSPSCRWVAGLSCCWIDTTHISLDLQAIYRWIIFWLGINIPLILLFIFSNFCEWTLFSMCRFSKKDMRCSSDWLTSYDQIGRDYIWKPSRLTNHVWKPHQASIQSHRGTCTVWRV